MEFEPSLCVTMGSAGKACVTAATIISFPQTSDICSHEAEELWVLLSDHRIRIYNLKNLDFLGQLERTDAQHSRGNAAVTEMMSFGMNDKRFLGIFSASGIVLFCAEDRCVSNDLSQYNESSAPVTFCLHNPEKSLIWTGTVERAVVIWSYSRTGVRLRTKVTLSHPAERATLLKQDVFIGGSGTISVVDGRSFAVKHSWNAHPFMWISSLLSLPSHSHIWSIDTCGQVNVWDAHTYDSVDRFRLFEIEADVCVTSMKRGVSEFEEEAEVEEDCFTNAIVIASPTSKGLSKSSSSSWNVSGGMVAHTSLQGLISLDLFSGSPVQQFPLSHKDTSFFRHLPPSSSLSSLHPPLKGADSLLLTCCGTKLTFWRVADKSSPSLEVVELLGRSFDSSDPSPSPLSSLTFSGWKYTFLADVKAVDPLPLSSDARPLSPSTTSPLRSNAPVNQSPRPSFQTSAVSFQKNRSFCVSVHRLGSKSSNIDREKTEESPKM